MTLSNTMMLVGGEDFLRKLIEFMLNCIMEADVTQYINAEPTSAAMSAKPTTTAIVTVSPRQLGTLDLRIPKLFKGTYFPPFLEAHKLSEKALNAVIQEAWINGILADLPAEPEGGDRQVFSASWQRCRVHFMRNVLSRVSRANQSVVRAALQQVFVQTDEKSVHATRARLPVNGRKATRRSPG